PSPGWAGARRTWRDPDVEQQGPRPPFDLRHHIFLVPARHYRVGNATVDHAMGGGSSPVCAWRGSPRLRLVGAAGRSGRLDQVASEQYGFVIYPHADRVLRRQWATASAMAQLSTYHVLDAAARGRDPDRDVGVVASSVGAIIARALVS